MSGNGQAPPAVVEAEQATLGAAMADPAALRWMLRQLRAEDFWRPAHRTIYEAIAQLAADGQPVTEVSVLTALRVSGGLADVGGASGLHDLTAAIDMPAAVGFHGRQVSDAARLRRLSDVGHKITALAHQQPWEPERAEGLALGLVNGLHREDDETTADPGGIITAMAADATADLYWNLPDLDRLTKGLHRRHLIVVASRPTVGKSSLALQLAARAAERCRVVVASYEMSRAEIGQHHLALYADMELQQVPGAINSPALDGPKNAYRQLDLLVLDGMPALDRLTACLYSLHAERPLGLVVVDYLQLIDVDLGRGANRQQEVAAISRALRLLAGRLDVPVVALSQLNRQAADRRPTLADLRESGAIEADANQVILLHKDDQEPDVVEANLAKNRMGPTGVVSLGWQASRTMFHSFRPHQARLTP